jgi:hypothetical protein
VAIRMGFWLWKEVLTTYLPQVYAREAVNMLMRSVRAPQKAVQSFCGIRERTRAGANGPGSK